MFHGFICLVNWFDDFSFMNVCLFFRDEFDEFVYSIYSVGYVGFP